MVRASTNALMGCSGKTENTVGAAAVNPSEKTLHRLPKFVQRRSKTTMQRHKIHWHYNTARGVRWAYFILLGICALSLGVAYTEPECTKDRDCAHGMRCVGGACKVKP